MNKDKTDGKSDDFSKITHVGHFINYVRVATAVAVIRCKPLGVPILQHAKVFCAEYAVSQQRWKDKVTNLEEEILCLQQKLVKSQLNFQQTSGYNHESLPLYLTPPSSSDTEDKQCSLEKHKLTEHTNFLHSLIVLKSVSDSNVPVKEDNVISELEIKTVDRALQICEKWMCNAELYRMLPSKSVKYCIDVIVQLQDKKTTLGQDQESDKISQLILNFAKAILDTMFGWNRLNDCTHRDELQRILKTLAKSKNLQTKLTLMLVDCIQKYSEVLREIKQKRKAMEPHFFENLYSVLECLESVVESHMKHLPKEELEKDCIYNVISRELERSLLHISETFPCFAHYVWHIGGMIETLAGKV